MSQSLVHIVCTTSTKSFLHGWRSTVKSCQHTSDRDTFVATRLQLTPCRSGCSKQPYVEHRNNVAWKSWVAAPCRAKNCVGTACSWATDKSKLANVCSHTGSVAAVAHCLSMCLKASTGTKAALVDWVMSRQADSIKDDIMGNKHHVL